MTTEESTSALERPSARHQQMVRETLQSILDSPEFRKSHRYPMLLKYIVLNTLEGNLDGLKERIVGTEVFHRPPGYDPSADAIVRTTAGEVRRRMAVYFSEHPEAPVRIELPVGGYAAEFHFRSQVCEDLATDPLPVEFGIEAPSAFSPGARAESVASVAKTNVLHSRARTSYFLIATVLLLAVGAAAWASYLHHRAQVDFWWPVLQNDAPALIVIGRNPRDKPPAAVNNEPSEQVVADEGQSNTAMGNALTLARICSVFRDNKRECNVTPVQSASLDELRNKTVVLVGGLDNAWTLRLLAPFRYQFIRELGDPNAASARLIVDQYHSGSTTVWKDSSNAPSLTTDYAIVSRFHSDIIDGTAVVAAGISQLGTIRAGEYLSSPEKMQQLIDLAPQGWKGLNFEAVLQVDVVQGKAGHVKVIATQFW